jgi:TBCC domain-containing protein 1
MSSSGDYSGGGSGGGLVGLDATWNSMDGMTLTAKPHAFAGAVLSPKHARELTPSLCLAIASALEEQSYRKTAVPYTLWITEAWRVLGWAEPSAALFWEMATMYHTLYLAGRAYASDFHDNTFLTSNNIPPILSCGSTSSMGSGNTHHTDRMGSTGGIMMDRKKYSTSSSAKELPVWLVATFLLMHCEEMAYQRNLSSLDDRRFYGGGSGTTALSDPLMKNGGKVDFTSLLKYPGLSPRYE